MPLYEYECDACAHRFEVIQKLSDPLIEKCPVCGGSVHKLQSAPSFQFKGSGWYVTDYARKDGGKAKKEGSQESSATTTDKNATEEKSEKSDKTEKSAKPAATSTSDK